ncbi:hypothetical protein PoB_002581200 [Plakobranchus ocellatus]|uniref:Uncharacterized protein n=1 Tax=Plakobranchus ocellatus TaxID=259542 RepID=A0AAV3ZXM0_9GAST|nr:hypothetical protein PoB_002581200 [Plakobranchus ocellatus]
MFRSNAIGEGDISRSRDRDTSHNRQILCVTAPKVTRSIKSLNSTRAANSTSVTGMDVSPTLNDNISFSLANHSPRSRVDLIPRTRVVQVF